MTARAAAAFIEIDATIGTMEPWFTTAYERIEDCTSNTTTTVAMEHPDCRTKRHDRPHATARLKTAAMPARVA
jgi:hypothetical protein